MGKLVRAHESVRRAFDKECHYCKSKAIEILMQWAMLHPDDATAIIHEAYQRDLETGKRPLNDYIMWKDDLYRRNNLIPRFKKEFCEKRNIPYSHAIRSLISARSCYGMFNSIKEVIEWKLSIRDNK